MDNRSLHIEAHITGAMGTFDCPVELKLYGTNEPVERENLLSQMRADKLPIGHAADRKRKEAAAEKERQKLAKEAAKNAKKKGGVVVETNTYNGENGMTQFMGGSSQGAGPGPSLEDIIGGSERFNPRNVDQVVEEFGVKESDLVCDKFAVKLALRLMVKGKYAKGIAARSASYTVTSFPIARLTVDARPRIPSITCARLEGCCSALAAPSPN